MRGTWFVTYNCSNVHIQEIVLIVCRFIQYLRDAGFSKEKEITFPDKQSAFMRLRRETFDGPTL